MPSPTPIDRSHLLTERRLDASENLDAMTVEDQVALFHQQDLLAVQAVGKIGPEIAAAVRLITDRMKRGGRLFYVGAGTSGRLGVLDASEIPPTFRADPTLVQGIIAGGTEAIFRAQEGAEDNYDQGGRELDDRNVSPTDIVCGIAAGGTTPFVWGALARAKQIGAGTLFLSCVQPVPNEPAADVTLRPLTGPEVLTGSTRLKAATATKLILNTLTTLTMVALGKTYGNRMVDLKASNAKLRQRAIHLIADLANIDKPQAEKLLDAANGHVKLALTMSWLDLPADQAQAKLSAANGNLRLARGL